MECIWKVLTTESTMNWEKYPDKPKKSSRPSSAISSQRCEMVIKVQVSYRYWPLTTPHELVCMELMKRLQEQGLHVYPNLVYWKTSVLTGLGTAKLALPKIVIAHEQCLLSVPLPHTVHVWRLKYLMKGGSKSPAAVDKGDTSWEGDAQRALLTPLLESCTTVAWVIETAHYLGNWLGGPQMT